MKVQLLAFYIETLKVAEKVIAVSEAKSARIHLEESHPEILISNAHPAYLQKNNLWPRETRAPATTRLILISDEQNNISPCEAIKLGAHGLVDCQTDIHMVAQVILMTTRNRFLFHGNNQDVFDKKPQGPDLSPREREVLTLIARGQRTKEIAATLQLSPRTVEKYREILCRKTGHADTANLTLFALEAGFLA